MTKPRFVIDTDEKLKQKVKIKAAQENRSITEIVIAFLKGWVKK